jgi:hypothetical protein
MTAALMTFDWQDAITLPAVVVAASYLFWRGWLALKRKRASCGGCASCPASQGEKTIVSIELRKLH